MDENKNWVNYKRFDPETNKKLYWYQQSNQSGYQIVTFNTNLDHIIVCTCRTYNYSSSDTGEIESTSIVGLRESVSSTIKDPYGVNDAFVSISNILNDYTVGGISISIPTPASVFTSAETIHRKFYEASNIKIGDTIQTKSKGGNDHARLIIAGYLVS